MGGRRAVSISQVLGPARDEQQVARLHQALQSGTAEQIADVSSRLAREALSPTQAAEYLRLFLPFVRTHLKEPLAPDERRKAVRHEWTQIKKNHGLEVRGVINDAVVQAVLDLLRAR